MTHACFRSPTMQIIGLGVPVASAFASCMAASAVIAVSGSAFAVAQPTEQQGKPVPFQLDTLESVLMHATKLRHLLCGHKMLVLPLVSTAFSSQVA